MLDQLFEGLRKGSESSLKLQQDIFRQWTQPWLSPNAAAEGPGEAGQALRKRWLELTLELLEKHRESLDAAYKTAIDNIEQTLRVSEAKTPEDYRQALEETWRKLFESFKEQSEAQFRDFQKWSSRSAAGMAQGAQA